jgi:hypothetical protein
MKRILTAAIAAAAVTLVGCDSITGNNDAGEVTLGFSTASTSTSALYAGLSASVVAADGHELVLTGENGTLTISDVRFIVNEFKLERDDAPCEDLDDEAEDACEEFETGLAFVDLPLNGSTVAVVTQTVPAGTYLGMKFEAEDVDLDEADEEDAAEIAALIQQIEAAGFTDWPENASLVVVGTFTPTGGEAKPFTAYFEAEIKVEMEFDPPLVIDGETGTLDIVIDPAAWYTNLDGTVMDLSAFDYATTGQVVEFEAKFEDGFTKIELEGFDD